VLDTARRAFPSCVAMVCGYETIAIASRGRIPTITALQKRYRILGPVVVGGLIAHFYGEFLQWSEKTEVCGSI
jgi:hypothetical protein